MSERQKIRLALSAEAERYARRDAPVEVRRMAAGGALPLPPVEIATVLFVLVHDPNEEVKERARASLEALPDRVAEAALSGPAHPAVLSFCAQLYAERPERLEPIALNANADDTTFAYLAGLPHKRIVDIVSNNQQRMLRCPEIVEALGSNPLTGRSVIDRILSFLGLERPDTEAPEDDDASLPPPDPVTDAEASAVLAAVLGEDVGGFARQLVDDGAELSEEEAKSLHALVQHMSVFDKIKLARLGNKEARGLLVRDRNKLVASAAVRSPKVTENEIAGFAKARNVCDEVLRIIASSREWTRSYQVKQALASNPKTPQQAAIKFLNYLQDRDLRAMMKSKDVPSAISNHARRLLQRKGKI
ncbi:MAG: hypothetical protein QNK03_17705 [Myxococcota bacterium]|nr:hypothetical protein [Myxococcota bacterium]